MSFPILYDKMETEFGHLGLGVLRDAISCIVTEERNGIFELEMEYPISGALFDLLENDRIIKVDAGHELKEQRFRIKRITKNMNGFIGVYAEHVSYLTQDLTLTPEIELRGNAQQALNQWKNNMVDKNPFEVFSDVALDRVTKLNIQDFDTARRVLGGIEGSILEVWGGEYKFDNYRISLLENRGGNSNTLISYGRNLTDLDQEENIANTFTSVYPFAVYRDHSEDGSSSNEQLITIDGYIVDSEHVNKYPNRRILPIDFSSEFESDVKPTQARLRTLAQQYIQSHNIGVPKVSLNVSFVDLTKSLEFNGLHYEQVNLCDVVPIYFEELGIRARAKINRIRWDVLLDQYESLEIGDARMTLSDKIRDLQDDINNIDNRPPVIGGENIANIPPQRVTGFSAHGGFNAIHLFWDNQGIHVERFELYASVVSNFVPNEYDRIYRGRSNAFTHLVDVNRQYFYRCRAVNYHGVVGEWSVEVSAQTVNTKDIDELEGHLDELNDNIDDLNNHILPNLNDRIDDNKDRLDALRDVTLPELEQDLSNAHDNINNALGNIRDVEEIMDNWKYEDTVEIDGGAIRADTITAKQIRAGTVTAVEIEAGSITGDRLEMKTITAEQIKANAITANEIAVGTITADEIAVSTITANEIAVDAITAEHIKANAITANKIAADTITANHIRANAITVDKISTNAISARHIQAGAIVADSIATGAVRAVHIQAGTITGDHINGRLLQGITLQSSSGNNLVRITNGRVDVHFQGQANNIGMRLDQGTLRIMNSGIPPASAVTPPNGELAGFTRLHNTAFTNIIGTAIVTRGTNNGMFFRLASQGNMGWGFSRSHIQTTNNSAGTTQIWGASAMSAIAMNNHPLTGLTAFNGNGDVDIRKEKALRVRKLGTTNFTNNTEIELISYVVDGEKGLLMCNQYPVPKGGFWIGENGSIGIMVNGVVRITKGEDVKCEKD